VLHINPSYLPDRPVDGFLGARESVPCMAVGIVSILVWLMVMTNTDHGTSKMYVGIARI